MRIFISILGICSHMMLKDEVECQDKLTRAWSKAAARVRQVCSGRPPCKYYHTSASMVLRKCQGYGY